MVPDTISSLVFSDKQAIACLPMNHIIANDYLWHRVIQPHNFAIHIQFNVINVNFAAIFIILTAFAFIADDEIGVADNGRFPSANSNA